MQGYKRDCKVLCRKLTQIAELYGILTGTAGTHKHRKVEREIRHLRQMRFETHRPLTLRFLYDSITKDENQITHETLAKTIRIIGTWITRLWLADRPTAGLNKAIAELANRSTQFDYEKYTEYWQSRIRNLRNLGVGVPTDEEIEHGIHTGKAYGGRASDSSLAVLYAMTEAEHKEETPPIDPLTIEHVMPQTLTKDWESMLGDNAEDIHKKYLHRLANLTLKGNVSNVILGNASFENKKVVYERSSIRLTRLIATETVWNEETLTNRSKYLTKLALKCWSWQDDKTKEDRSKIHSTNLKWRIVDSRDSQWQSEHTASDMVLNVAAALLDSV